MAKSSLDAIDKKILRFLIKNARTPFLEIARDSKSICILFFRG